MKKLLCYFVCAVLIGFASCSDDETVISNNSEIIEDSAPSQAMPSSGFYIVNEDWFGHDVGTINYFSHDGTPTYRAYRAANPDDKLGVTSQYATIYGDNIYVVSKQGNRLVVADAKTLKKKVALEDIKGDGRSFIGVNPEKGYIATYNGITVFNNKDMVIGNSIEGIKGETGNMCIVGNRVFAVVKSKGLYIIKTDTDEVEALIEGTFATVVQSKDGNLWIGANKSLIKLDPYTLDKEVIDITQAPIDGTWFAWNAGSLCASTQQNVLYWAKGRSVVKYDIDTKELNTELYTIEPDSEGKARSFYAAGLRVDPLNDKLILTVYRSGWGVNFSYNWIIFLSNSGVVEKEIEVKGGSGAEGTENDNYYWFPSMPVFEDANAPEILLNQIIVRAGETKLISLNEKIVDADNTSVSIIKSLEYDSKDSMVQLQLRKDWLLVKASERTGDTSFTLNANSNGKIVSKQIRIKVID